MFAGQDRVKRVMSNNRFCKLNQYLHLSHNHTEVPRGEKGHNPVQKVLPLLDIMKVSCRTSYDLDRDLFIDEAMVCSKGQKHRRRSNSKKFAQWGFKVWTLAESKSGYIADFEVLRRKQGSGCYVQGVGFAIIDTFSKAYYNQHRHLYFDKFFSSVELLDHLSAHNTYACCTILSTRKGLPKKIKSPGELKRGESVMMQRGILVATVWRDKEDIHLISTNCQPTVTTVQRRIRKEKRDMPCPTAITMYNTCMQCVDAEEQPWLYERVGRHGKRSWHSFIWYMVGTAVNNAYILYKSSHQQLQPKNAKPLSHVDFRMRLLDQLIGGFTCRKNSSRVSTEPPVLEESTLPGHVLIHADKRRLCVNCVKLGRKTAKGHGKRTAYKCRICKVNLCKDGCLVEYHTKLMR